MSYSSIYHDIAKRTNGDIYIGVVGPVRTGKSTFIKRFMETTVLPAIENDYDKQRAKDEMPQSATGKTVMTTEPKFVPDEAVSVKWQDGTSVRVRAVDCVGYVVPEALGQTEEGAPRMVHTPWSKEPLPFKEAAELGTRKVITEHSTIAMLVTTDGTISEIPRESYKEAEEKVAAELEKAAVPYAIILNSAAPESKEAIALAYELENKYNAPVALVNCQLLDKEDIKHILELVLHEFPVTELSFVIPAWCHSLPEHHPIKESFREQICHIADNVAKMGDIKKVTDALTPNEYIESVTPTRLSSDTGTATFEIKVAEGLYFKTLSELTGHDVPDEAALFCLLQELSETARAYEQIEEALQSAEEKGYGIVMPKVQDLHLEEPRIVKQAGGYGVRLRASAKSIHMIRAQIETEINPVVGTEAQSEELVQNMLSEFKESPEQLWQSNLFGKSLYELVGEGLQAKLSHMPEESRQKLSETLERIINEGSGGLICILL
ncbi:MAG: stage IV sporulation protein A [Clostridia bacterium]|nr:stage IV sporulation protein A [Clostridia bacterium]